MVSQSKRKKILRALGYTAGEVKVQARLASPNEKDWKKALDDQYVKLEKKLADVNKVTVAQRHEVRTFYDKKPKDIVADAKLKRISVNAMYNKYLQGINSKEKVRVCTFRLWHEENARLNRGKWHDNHYVFKTFDGVEYYQFLTSKTVTPIISISLPTSLAKTWTSSEIPDLRQNLEALGVKYRDLIGLLNTDSSDKVLELVSNMPAPEVNANVLSPSQTRNFNSTQLLISDFVTNELYEDLRPSMREQIITGDYDLPNLCALNCIMKHLAPRIAAHVRTLKDTPKNRDKLITYTKIGKILGKSLSQISREGVSFNEVIEVCKDYNQKAVMINVRGHIEAEFLPENRGFHYNRDTVLTLLRHDGHLYPVDDQYKKRNLIESRPEETRPKYIKNKFPNFNEKKNGPKPTFETCIATLEELHRHMIASQEKFQFYIWRGDPDLKPQVLQLMSEGYMVKINALNGFNMIINFSIPGPSGGTVTVKIIELPDGCIGLTDDELRNYFYTNQNYLKIFLSKSTVKGFLSKYSPSLKEMLHTFRGAPFTGLYYLSILEDIVKLDQNKCFPWHLRELSHIPVFTQFDVSQAYDGHQIEPFSLYHYEGGAEFGFALEDDKDIISFVRPTRVKKNTLKEHINNIFSSNLPESLQKQIMVSVIGWMGKKYNSVHYADLFQDEMECDREYLDDAHSEKFEYAPGLWMLRYFDEVEFDEGFLPLHKCVYDSVNSYFRKMRKGLEAQGIYPIGIQTDALIVSKEDAAKLDYPWKKDMKHCVENLGKFKKEHGNIKGKKLIKIRHSCNTILPVAMQPTSIVQYMEHEKDWRSPIGDYFEEFTAALGIGNSSILGPYPGLGKSKMAIDYCLALEDEGPWIIACPTNSLARKYKNKHLNACTYYSLCNARLFEEHDEGLTNHGYLRVVLEELFMLSSVQLGMVFSYMKHCPKTQFIATGDPLQIKPIEDEFNVLNKDWYIRAVQAMFPNEIHLNIPKRLTYPDRDIPRLVQLKQDLFSESPNLQMIVRNFVKPIDNWLSKLRWTWSGNDERNTLFVSYFNETRHRVNAIVHEKLGYKEYYEIDLEYICKKTNWKKLIINNTYKLLRYNEEYILFQDVFSLEEIPINRYSQKTKEDFLDKKYFSLPYCLTGHSIQGESRDGNIVIFDVNSSHVDSHWIYVVLTRARDFDNVFCGDSEFQTMSKKRIAKKLQDYWNQDVKRFGGTVWKKEEYCTVDDILNLSKTQKHLCALCNDVMNMRNVEGDYKWNWSLDRKNDSLPHIKGNCHLTHLACNCAHLNNKC